MLFPEPAPFRFWKDGALLRLYQGRNGSLVLKGQRRAGAWGLVVFEFARTLGDYVLLGDEKSQVAKVTFSSCDWMSFGGIGKIEVHLQGNAIKKILISHVQEYLFWDEIRKQNN